MSLDEHLERVDLGGMSGLTRRGDRPDSPVAILLHGHGGDEKVMWVFSDALSRRWTVISLRGIVTADDGGLRWHGGRRWPPPDAEVFLPAVEAIRRGVAPEGTVLWIGFSQGAALALCCAAAGLPAAGVACLAGYMPGRLAPLAPGLPVFWSHGRRDDKIPIESARLAAEQLRAWKVRLEFCEADGGHKVGAGCVRALRRWVAGLAASNGRP
jgi:predicted esterase